MGLPRARTASMHMWHIGYDVSRLRCDEIRYLVKDMSAQGDFWILTWR